MVKSNNSMYLAYGIIIVLMVCVIYLFYQNHNQKENFWANSPCSNETIQPIQPIQPIVNDIQRTPKQINSLDRVYNPLRYPYKSHEYYNQNWRPNLALPPQVVGCGGRNTPCLGGSQVPIANPMFPLSISNNNIAPINIRTRGPLGEPQQVGSLYKLYSHDNEVLPLFGRKKYPNGSYNWEYYTMVGNYDTKLRVVQKRRGDELGTNDVVFIKGYNKAPYRVTMYEYDFPQYIPYL